MASITTRLYPSPYGNLILGSFNNELCLCNWQNKANKQAIEKRLFNHFKAVLTTGNNDLLDNVVDQLNAYFDGEATSFDLPIITAGTDFQQQVWQALQTIPYGQTRSYAELAQSIGNHRAVRAVANANAANALSIIIPCHRIIGTNGTLVGYAGGLAAKQGLITFEQTIN